MENELNDVLKEMAELYEFNLAISELSLEEMLERIGEREPSYIEDIGSTTKTSDNHLNFWAEFCIWSIVRLKEKYRHIWKELKAAYFNSPAAKRLAEKYELPSAIRSQIDEILQKSDF